MVSAGAGAARQRGFALLVVLWTLGFLALLVAGLAASARGEAGLAGNVRSSTVAQAAADGAVQQTVFQLLRGAWTPGGPVYRLAVGNAAVEVTTEDESRRFNPNFSSPAMLAALIGAFGVEPAQANDLARVLVDWRTAATISLAGGLKLDRYRLANLPYGPPDRPFESVDEMGLVPGMTLDLLARLRPYLSVYQAGDASETANLPLGRDIQTNAGMIGRGSALVGYTSPDRVVSIRATAELKDGARFVRRAVVRLLAQPRPGERAWQLVTWQ